MTFFLAGGCKLPSLRHPPGGCGLGPQQLAPDLHGGGQQDTGQPLPPWLSLAQLVGTGHLGNDMPHDSEKDDGTGNALRPKSHQHMQQLQRCTIPLVSFCRCGT